MSRRARARGPQHTSTERGNAPRRVRWTALFAVAAMTFTTVSGAALAESQSGDSGTTAAGPTSASTEGGSAAPAQGAQSGSETASNVREVAAPAEGPDSLGDGGDASDGDQREEDSGRSTPREVDTRQLLGGELRSTAGAFKATVTPAVQCLDCADGFTLRISDDSPSDTYFVTGLPTDWVVEGVGLETMSVEPLIVSVPGELLRGEGVLLKPPAGYQGTLAGVRVLKADQNKNLITDFDNGTFDYDGNNSAQATAKPQLLEGNAPKYQYHDPTTRNDGYYSPKDGFYSIWPTATTLGPNGGTRNQSLYNNKWADLRSILNPLSLSVRPSESLWALGDNQYSEWLDPNNRRNQVSNDEAATSGKILVVNGDDESVIRTTVEVQPGQVYLFTGYFANASFNRGDGTLRGVQIDFGAQYGNGDRRVIGVSAPSTPQNGWRNSDTSWTKVAGYLSPTSGSVTLSLNNHNTGGAYGNDFVVDQLELHPMTAADVPALVVQPGTLMWRKTDEAANLLKGSEWTLKGPGVPEGTVVADCTQNGACGTGPYVDQDPTPGVFKIVDLPCGEYEISERTAPAGYRKTDRVGKGTIGSGTDTSALNVDLGAFENSQDPGSISWTKVDEDGQTLLGGSSWILEGPGVPNGTEILDCVTEAGCGDGQYVDQDPVSGQFRVTGLQWGRYSITEKSAPKGYQVLADKFSFPEINADSLHVTLADPITNERKTGQVSWQKADLGGNKLGASEWTITPKDPDGTALTVVDDRGNDIDQTPGAFKVAELKWGTYTLKETRAPAGYVISDKEYEFTISADSLEATVNGGAPITNKQYDTPSLPLTGGMGTDTFLLLGGGLIAAAGVGGWVHRRRSLRMQTA